MGQSRTFDAAVWVFLGTFKPECGLCGWLIIHKVLERNNIRNVKTPYFCQINRNVYSSTWCVDVLGPVSWARRLSVCPGLRLELWTATLVVSSVCIPSHGRQMHDKSNKLCSSKPSVRSPWNGRLQLSLQGLVVFSLSIPNTHILSWNLYLPFKKFLLYTDCTLYDFVCTCNSIYKGTINKLLSFLWFAQSLFKWIIKYGAENLTLPLSGSTPHYYKLSQ